LEAGVGTAITTIKVFGFNGTPTVIAWGFDSAAVVVGVGYGCSPKFLATGPLPACM
jgi:hypothetical protein